MVFCLIEIFEKGNNLAANSTSFGTLIKHMYVIYHFFLLIVFCDFGIQHCFLKVRQ